MLHRITQSLNLNWTITKKITCGFGLILLGLGVVSYVGYSSMDKAAKGFEEYQATADASHLVSNIELDMLHVDLGVKEYLLTRDEKVKEKIEKYKKVMLDELAEGKEKVHDPEIYQEFGVIETDIKRYSEAFGRLVEIWEKRDHLVKEVLKPNGHAMEVALQSSLEYSKTSDDVLLTYHSGVALEYMLIAELKMAEYLTFNDDTLIDEMHVAIKKVSKAVDKLKTLSKDDGINSKLDEVAAGVKIYDKKFSELVGVVKLGNSIKESELDTIGEKIEHSAHEINVNIFAKQKQIGKRVDEEDHVALSMIGAVSGVSLGLGVLLSVLITGMIRKPLFKMEVMLKDIAEGEGDLTQRLDDSKADEIGRCAKWFNVFVGKLQGIMDEIGEKAELLNGSSGALSHTAEGMAESVQTMNNQTGTAAAAAEEMTINMQNMSTSSEEMASNIKNVAEAISEMNSSITEVSESAKETSRVAQDAAKLANVSNDNVAGLGDAAEEIGKVVAVIQEIAEQTNLLALNATIEAARAGEAGKGFSVVATEVKELAKQTAEATLNISDRIAVIQKSANDSVSSIGEINKVIGDVSQLSINIAAAVEQQSKNSHEIGKSVEQVALASESVSAGVSESAMATQEITHTITNVSTVSLKTSEGANQTKAASQGVASAAEDLKLLVGQFQV